jgi:lincosamide nucleotidyltransferase
MTDHLQRLQEIARNLADETRALALLALGSIGRDRQRLDEHSDLDFFVIATQPEALLSDLRWLGQPLQWAHRDTPDGCKALVDGLFHEFAVFPPDRFPGVGWAILGSNQ